ncbi:MAG: radical SAM protein [Vicinamibacterales bacterium]|nr:radical SAM protein [Vicinamibacterales bacterium]
MPAVRKSTSRKTTARLKRVAQTSPLMALHEGVVYGPIRSRRLGRSLGINLTPPNVKLCTFNCTYCQYGWTQPARGGGADGSETWPSPSAVARAVRAAIRGLASRGDGVDRLTLAGHGEPTMHPQFPEVVEELRALRDELVPGVPIAVLSNASTLDRPGVREALLRVDERYMKLDAGDANTLRTVNGSTTPLDALVQRLADLPGIVVQAMFVKDRAGRIDNTTDMAVINWVVALQRIKPASVHIYTVDRAPAWPYLQAAPVTRLHEIAQRVRLAGIECEVFTRPEKDPTGLVPRP